MEDVMKIRAVVAVCFAVLLASPAFAGEVNIFSGIGFTAPNVNGTANVAIPQLGDIVWDHSALAFYGYGNSQWNLMSGSGSASPAGVIEAYGGSTAPAGYLLCDGSAVSRTTYSALFSAIGATFGSGDGSTTFNLPDLRGRFLRGVDGTAGRDPDATSRTAMASGGNTGNAVGSVQADAFQGHWHGTEWAQGTLGSSAGFARGSTPVSSSGEVTDPISDGVHGTPRVSSETRPVNAYVNYIIKY